MKRNLLFLFLLVFAASANAQQKVLVPENVYVADVHLKLSKGAQDEIQKHVDFLLQYPTYFQQKVDRADTYFPIIERIFKEEGLPNDFKYLVLQESGLVSDAVSTSNAVGFWQFKKEAASDVGLAITSDIDERKHIVESSRGAAKYLIKHNNFYNNWVVTLLSYNLGFTGAKSTPEAKHAGKKVMPIEKDTHIYIQKFLAHKIAFENFVCRNPNPSLKLEEYAVNGGGSLHDIARVTKVDIVELEKYNKWLGAASIPTNKTYTVILPVKNGEAAGLAVASSAGTTSASVTSSRTLNPGFKPGMFTSVNGLKSIVASAGDTKDKLAMQAGISTKKLLKFNDMNSFDPFVEGQSYYIQNKRTSAEVEYYVAQPGESLQMIAQKHGVREKSIRSKNRMAKDEVLVAGRKLWMKKTRPRYTPAEYERLTEAKEKTGEELPEKIQAKVNFAALYSNENTQTEEEEPEVLISKGNEFIDELPEETPSGNIEETTRAVALAETPKTVIKTTPVARQVVQEQAAPQTTPDVEDADDALEALLNTDDSAETPAPEPVAVKNPAPAVVKKAAAPEKPAVTAEKATTKPASKTPETVVPVKSAPAKPTEHTVAKGESFFSISRLYGTTTAELMAANNLKSTALSIGQILKLPTGEEAAAPENPVVTTKTAMAKAEVTKPKPAGSATKTHTVVQGESMYQIARRHNITVIDLLELNNRTDTNLKPGEVLIIQK